MTHSTMGYLHTAAAKCLPGNIFKKGRISLANDLGESIVAAMVALSDVYNRGSVWWRNLLTWWQAGIRESDRD